MTLTRLTPLDGEAILSLEDAKEHLRVRHDDEDTLISALRDAAIGHIERMSGVALAETNYRWSSRSFDARIDLPVRPVTGVGEVTYYDSAGETTTYTGARLIEDNVLPAFSECWPSANGYAAVTFTAGLTSPNDAPELLAAAKLMLGHLYENRSGVSDKPGQEVPLGVDALVQTYRRLFV